MCDCSSFRPSSRTLNIHADGLPRTWGQEAAPDAARAQSTGNLNDLSTDMVGLTVPDEPYSGHELAADLGRPVSWGKGPRFKIGPGSADTGLIGCVGTAERKIDGIAPESEKPIAQIPSNTLSSNACMPSLVLVVKQAAASSRLPGRAK